MFYTNNWSISQFAENFIIRFIVAVFLIVVMERVVIRDWRPVVVSLMPLCDLIHVSLLAGLKNPATDGNYLRLVFESLSISRQSMWHKDT